MRRTRIVLLWLCGVAALTALAVILTLLARRFEPSPRADVEAPDPDIEGYDSGTRAEHEPRPAFATQAAPFLARHCTSCHAVERPKGHVVLAFPNEAAAIADLAVWSKVAEALRSGRMPPPDRPRPDPAEVSAFMAWLDGALSDGSGHRNPNRVTLRRLNRAEYNNTIRDLVGVRFRPADDFPADDSGDGFDTVGDVLSVSPTLIEKYLIAAEAVVEASAKDPELWQKLTTPPTEDYIPFVLRGVPPQRAAAVKTLRLETTNDQGAGKATEIDRAYYALQAFADRAYRCPVTHQEMYRLMRFVETALARGGGTDAGLKLAFEAILISPHFLFKMEPDPPPTGPDSDRRLTDFELATRLSYFLWSSMPDEELFRLAAGGKLHDPRNLVGQVRRMLRDNKSRALAENFAGQWLQTRALAEVTRDLERFPAFDENLRQAMREETDLFFDHVARTDQNVLDLLLGEYTFVNERLAQHYGLSGVTGREFRRVSLAGTGRAGVLTHASVLTVTSGPTRTSPVKRGKWLLDNILGMPPPPPPPGADTLKDPTGTATTLRERLELHRSRPECASCHARMDPLGYGLESFDAVGTWREREGNAPVDASGTMPDGRPFRGASELRTRLAEKPDDFVRCLTEKLMTYALGRGLTLSDRPAIDWVVRHAARNNYRFFSLVIALVRSNVFLRR
jgi:Protein of unknown function (DUF1592)/Protein of unknown function (DUF1588)/Protein of unknown function (DUF1587)/Protein of unknown function (DUF1585)/Protein of unknown function (DUF1595)